MKGTLITMTNAEIEKKVEELLSHDFGRKNRTNESGRYAP